MEMNRTYFKTLFWKNSSVTYFHKYIVVGFPWDFFLSRYFNLNDFLYNIFINAFMISRGYVGFALRSLFCPIHYVYQQSFVANNFITKWKSLKETYHFPCCQLELSLTWRPFRVFSWKKNYLLKKTRASSVYFKQCSIMAHKVRLLKTRFACHWFILNRRVEAQSCDLSCGLCRKKRENFELLDYSRLMASKIIKCNITHNK